MVLYYFVFVLAQIEDVFMCQKLSEQKKCSSSFFFSFFEREASW
jgi:hypothetical protein